MTVEHCRVASYVLALFGVPHIADRPTATNDRKVILRRARYTANLSVLVELLFKML